MCLLRCRNWFAGSSNKNGAPNAPVIQSSRAQHLLGQVYINVSSYRDTVVFGRMGAWEGNPGKAMAWGICLFLSPLPPLYCHHTMWTVYGTAWKPVLYGEWRSSELLYIHGSPQTWIQISALSLLRESCLISLSFSFLVCKEA